jgi:histidinol-phosphatase (PHP family)
MMYVIGDFHVHTSFCPHGSYDKTELYVKKALDRGLKYLSFTEHAPLPEGFIDPAPSHDSAMKLGDVEAYFDEVDQLKQKYRDKIMIKSGFEVDYLDGLEDKTEALLNTFGEKLEDSILSVHMLKAPNGEWVCIDFSPEEYERIIGLYGSTDAVYEAYYKTLLKAVQADLGIYKPKRIGHLTLIEKFSKRYPSVQRCDEYIDRILKEIKDKGYALDANSAGYYKELCGSVYPSPKILIKAQKMNIPIVFGSDSHTADHIGRGLQHFPKGLTFTIPR